MFLFSIMVMVGIFIIVDWALAVIYGSSSVKRCDLHKWEYGPDGSMRCSICKHKALGDD